MQKVKKQKSLTSWKVKVFPYVLIAPNALIFSLFIVLPAIFGFYYSLTEWKGLGDPVFIGFQNYIELLGDEKFWEAMLRTCYYVLLALPLIMAIPLLLGYLLIKEIKARGFFRAAFYWPSMISYIVAGISFKFIFGDNTGVINYLLEIFGAQKVEWLTDGTMALIVVVLATVWSRSGFYMVTYIAGLQSIPESYYEAAQVDGASPLKQFFSITLPLLKPTTFLVMILALIDLFKAYGLVIALTGGGPGASTKFAVQYIYEQAFDVLNLGYASALSMVMFFTMAIFTLIQFSVNKGGSVSD